MNCNLLGQLKKVERFSFNQVEGMDEDSTGQFVKSDNIERLDAQIDIIFKRTGAKIKMNIDRYYVVSYASIYDDTGLCLEQAENGDYIKYDDYMKYVNTICL